MMQDIQRDFKSWPYLNLQSRSHKGRGNRPSLVNNFLNDSHVQRSVDISQTTSTSG